MGADIYLRSIYNASKDVPLNLRPNMSSEAFEELAAHKAKLEARGCYFRNGYNEGDVMWAMGLSWPHTVCPMLVSLCDDETGQPRGDILPVEQARKLVAIIEAHPLTREVVGAHIYKHFTDGRDEHPMQQMLRPIIEKIVGEQPELAPPDFDEMFTFLNQKRDRLLAILLKSIELDEPLWCDL
jgi:hypothetical protein